MLSDAQKRVVKRFTDCGVLWISQHELREFGISQKTLDVMVAKSYLTKKAFSVEGYTLNQSQCQLCGMITICKRVYPRIAFGNAIRSGNGFSRSSEPRCFSCCLKTCGAYQDS